MNIIINFTAITRPTTNFYHIPMATDDIHPDMYRESGYTAKIVDFNRLVITHPDGYYTAEYVVSCDLVNHDWQKMIARNDKESARFWNLVDKVAVARLNNLVRYINRATW